MAGTVVQPFGPLRAEVSTSRHSRVYTDTVGEFVRRWIDPCPGKTGDPAKGKSVAFNLPAEIIIKRVRSSSRRQESFEGIQTPCRDQRRSGLFGRVEIKGSPS